MEIEILNYIKDARAHGLSDKEIKQNLLDVGWDPGQVEDSFAFAKVQNKPQDGYVEASVPQTAAQPAAVSRPLAANPAAKPNFISAAAASPTVLSESHFADQPAKKSGKVVWLIAAIVILLGLGAGGYFAYGYYFPAPEKIWQKAKVAMTKQVDIATTDFKINYSDPGFLDDRNKLQSFTVFLNGNLYRDITNTSSPVFNTELTGGYKSGDLTASRGIKILFQDKVLYIDLSSITELAQIAGQPVNWVKLDMDELKKYAESSSDGKEVMSELDKNRQNQEKIQNDILVLLKNKDIIKVDKLLGTETVSGVSTYHLQNSFDKQLAKEVVNKVIDDAFTSNQITANLLTGPDLTVIKKTFGEVLDKIEIAKLETWVGKKDFQLYKILIDVKIPAIAGWGDSTSWENPLTSARSKARDAKRMAAMRQMQTALELYFNDHNGYPAAKNGEPVGLVPNYLSEIPQVPLPADGACSDYYNSYWYTPKGTPTTNNGLLVYPSYEYTFCLGQKTGAYDAGVAKITETGISANIPCTDANCIKPQNAASQNPDPGSQKGELSIEIINSGFGQKKTFTPPQNPLDAVEYLKTQMEPQPQVQYQPSKSSNDDKRIADMRQLSTALEMYFNDESKYPKTLAELAPKYIGQIPTAPMPPEGQCTESQNTYTYTAKEDFNNYTINFCFGSDTGGFKAGPHVLTNSGIN